MQQTPARIVMDKTLLNLLIFFMIVCFQTGTYAAPGTVPLQDHYVAVLPFIEQDRPVVQVKINNTVTANFLVDTGASYSDITPELAQKLGATRLPYIVNGQRIKENGKPSEKIVTSSFRLGPLNFTDMPLVISNYALAGAAGKTVDGLIGMDLLAEMTAVFDFQRQKVSFYFPSSIPLSVIPEIDPAKAFSVPVSDPLYNRLLWIDLTVTNGTRSEHEHTVLDTGSMITLVSATVAHRLGLQPSGNNSLGFLDGDYTSFNTSVSSLTWGELMLQNQFISYSTAPAKLYPSVFGCDILSKYLLLVDYHGMRVYLQPNYTVSFTKAK